ncbi:MAG: ATP-binding cassette domain-containing protein [Enterocloster sp.]|uniref:ATP-binding cassette domain-containing protein n=1 Tax=Enterocloster sp. TaxID=2719315 RepID=UPI00399AE937
MRRSFSRRLTASTGKTIPSFMTMFLLVTPRHNPARTESQWWWRKKCLHDISFPTAKAGQKTALVGESGSGKSTLAKLDPLL